MELRTLSNFPGVLFDPTKSDILFAEDYNAIMELMKPIVENSVNALLGIVDINLCGTIDERRLIYHVPIGYDCFISSAIALPLDGSDASSDCSIDLIRLSDDYQYGFVSVPTYNDAIGNFCFSTLGFIGGLTSQFATSNDTLAIRLVEPSTGTTRPLRVFIFGMITPQVV